MSEILLNYAYKVIYLFIKLSLPNQLHFQTLLDILKSLLLGNWSLVNLGKDFVRHIHIWDGLFEKDKRRWKWSWIRMDVCFKCDGTQYAQAKEGSRIISLNIFVFYRMLSNYKTVVKPKLLLLWFFALPQASNVMKEFIEIQQVISILWAGVVYRFCFTDFFVKGTWLHKVIIKQIKWFCIWVHY